MPEFTGKTESALFAGGCFWCMEADFEKVKGVVSVESGYSGGFTEKPTYEQVSAGGTGHAEAVLITYDPTAISYQDLLRLFWVNVDPTVKDQQFCDKGDQYRSAIFYLNDEQKKLADKSKEDIQKQHRLDSMYTQIEKAKPFYKAEDYHQDYYKKNPIRYKYYRYSCGRDKRLKQIWGSAREDTLNKHR